MTYAQLKGFVISGNDTIEATFKVRNLTPRSFDVIHQLKTKVKYNVNGKKEISTPKDSIDGFCIHSRVGKMCFNKVTQANETLFLYRHIGNKKEDFKVYRYGTTEFEGFLVSRLYTHYIIEKKSRFYYFTNTDFNREDAYKFLINLLDDCPYLVEVIKTENKSKIKTLKVFEKYLSSYTDMCLK